MCRITSSAAHHHFMLTLERKQFEPADEQLRRSIPLPRRRRKPTIIFALNIKRTEGRKLRWRQADGWKPLSFFTALNRHIRRYGLEPTHGFRRQRCNLCEKARGSLRRSDRNIHHASSTASLLIRRASELFYFEELLRFIAQRGEIISASSCPG